MDMLLSDAPYLLKSNRDIYSPQLRHQKHFRFAAWRPSTYSWNITFLHPRYNDFLRRLHELCYYKSYTDIPYANGLALLEYFLFRTPPYSFPTTNFLLPHSVLTRKSFLSNIYRQIRGTATSTRMAPSHSNLFIDYWENTT